MNKSILLSNGCSMCYGSELYDNKDKICENNQLRMKNSWPGVLGGIFGFSEVINLGFPGGSNDRIIRTTIKWVIENWITGKSNSDDFLLVCIGWSNPMRREFFIQDEWRQLIPHHDYSDDIISLFNRAYREIAWSEHESAVRFITQIISLQSFLSSHNIPYLFFDAITPFNLINQDAKGALNNYIPQVEKDNYLYFNELNGSMAARLNTNNDNTPSKHPNLADHKLWAQCLAEFIKNNNIIANKPTSISDKKIVFSGTESVDRLDIKIGLPKKPKIFKSNQFSRIKGMNDIHDQPIKKENFLKKLFHARKKDPFIYE